MNALVERHVYFLGMPDVGGIDPATAAPQHLALLIEKAAEAVAEQKEVLPWSYEEEGETIFPFFTSERLLREFAGSYLAEHDLVLPFVTAEARFLHLLHPAAAADRVVMNPRSEYCRPLRADERDFVAKVVENLEKGPRWQNLPPVG